MQHKDMNTTQINTKSVQRRSIFDSKKCILGKQNRRHYFCNNTCTLFNGDNKTAFQVLRVWSLQAQPFVKILDCKLQLSAHVRCTCPGEMNRKSAKL